MCPRRAIVADSGWHAQLERPTERRAKALPFPRGPERGNRLRKSGERDHHLPVPLRRLSGTTGGRDTAARSSVPAWRQGQWKAALFRVLSTDGVPRLIHGARTGEQGSPQSWDAPHVSRWME